MENNTMASNMDDSILFYEPELLCMAFEPDSPWPLGDQDDSRFCYSYAASTKKQRKVLARLIDEDGYNAKRIIDGPIHEIWHQDDLIGCVLSNEGIYDCGDSIDLRMSIDLVFIAVPWRGNNLSTFLMYYFTDRTLAALDASKEFCCEKDIKKLEFSLYSDYYSVGGELFVERFFSFISSEAADLLVLDDICFESYLEAGW